MFKFNKRHIEKGFITLLVLGVLWIVVNILLSSMKDEIEDHKEFHDIKQEIEELQINLDRQIVESNMLLNKVRDHLKSERNKSLVPPLTQPVLPVLVMSCDRVTISRCLDKIIKYRPNPKAFPIIISQDCNDEKTYKVIEQYVERYPTTISYIKQPDQSVIPLTKDKVKFRGYYNIARHFKFALSYVLLKLAFEAVIIVEDDLDIAPDFFEYFLGTYPLLKQDPSLWCISAWNDNGKVGLIDEGSPETLYRTDFFPGLGWMLRKETWLELVDKWPAAFFDDWLRNPDNIGGRACIRPEISRTYSFGKVGVSKGQFFSKHLVYIVLNENVVEFTKKNLTYLLKNEYDRKWALIKELPVMSAPEVLMVSNDPFAVQVQYSDAKSFKSVAKRLGAMEDYRSGIARTAYQGIVPLYINKRRVYITPSFQWERYNPSWN